jgi:predicted nuclease with RNAse H fold
LAGKAENPSGWALLRNKTVRTSVVYTNIEILEKITSTKPSIVAIDAPFKLPKKRLLRRVDQEMISRGLRVFPPRLPAIRSLTMRAIRLNKLIAQRGYRIEVHPTSTRKALNMPAKDWAKNSGNPESIGLRGDIEERALTSHEIDAVTAALTAYLHMQNQTKQLCDGREGYIVIPKQGDWSAIKL